MLILKGALGKALEKGVLGFLLFLDGIFYQVASWLYRLFYQLASVQLLSNEMYEAIASRVYLLVGVIALFIFTFLLLKSLVDPDIVGKGLISSFKSLVISLILLILMPTIFTYVYSFQAAIFQENIIEKFFNFDLKNNEKGSHDIDKESNYRTLTMDDYCSNSNPGSYVVKSTKAINASGKVTKNECQANYLFMTVMEAFFEPDDSNVTNEFGTSWIAARKYMIFTSNFNYVKSFAEPLVEEDNISYLPIVSSAAAIFLIYIILSFCIDIGVRAAKLAFYQIISPIPVLMKIIPGKEGQYEKWQKSTVNTFLEVFTRIIILNFVMFMCKNIINIINDLASNGNDIGMFGKAILILGLFTFAKQAPKLLQEAIGFEGGNLKLGIKDKVGEAALFGGMLGSAVGKLEAVPGQIGKHAFNNTKEGLKTGASKLHGASSGALGALWGAALSGGDIGAAVKLGMTEGFNEGGNQLKNQKDHIYKANGGKGEAGLFGQSIGSKMEDKFGVKAQAKAFKNAFKERFENSSEFTTKVDNKMNEFKAGLVSQATQDYNSAFQRANDLEIQSRASKDLISSLNSDINAFRNNDDNSGFFKDAFGNNRSPEETRRMLNDVISAGGSNASSAKAYLDNLDKLSKEKGVYAELQKEYNKAISAKTEANKKKYEAQHKTFSKDEIENFVNMVREDYRTSNTNSLKGESKEYQKILNEEYIKNDMDYQRRKAEYKDFNS